MAKKKAADAAGLTQVDMDQREHSRKVRREMDELDEGPQSGEACEDHEGSAGGSERAQEDDDDDEAEAPALERTGRSIASRAVQRTEARAQRGDGEDIDMDVAPIQPRRRMRRTTDSDCSNGSREAVEDIVMDKSEAPHSGCRKSKGNGRAKAAAIADHTSEEGEEGENVASPSKRQMARAQAAAAEADKAVADQDEIPAPKRKAQRARTPLESDDGYEDGGAESEDGGAGEEPPAAIRKKTTENAAAMVAPARAAASARAETRPQLADARSLGTEQVSVATPALEHDGNASDNGSQDPQATSSAIRTLPAWIQPHITLIVKKFIRLNGDLPDPWTTRYPGPTSDVMLGPLQVIQQIVDEVCPNNGQPALTVYDKIFIAIRQRGLYDWRHKFQDVANQAFDAEDAKRQLNTEPGRAVLSTQEWAAAAISRGGAALYRYPNADPLKATGWLRTPYVLPVIAHHVRSVQGLVDDRAQFYPRGAVALAITAKAAKKKARDSKKATTKQGPFSKIQAQTRTTWWSSKVADEMMNDPGLVKRFDRIVKEARAFTTRELSATRGEYGDEDEAYVPQRCVTPESVDGDN
ncbi:uncharacterized protein BXZ73DRAFT_104384 [Epithele typhae]|uniref:uncharacterized protein n=1 Tax=Epithele typhae TaxID=378194 RepID=UPI0020089947|nr:uncharacterized protein BXZ73DRAFT_104384 [Epithele typhae]KAH9921494.1 hypothetical protein BXZ73DRAFT_104384 [Epithele typhae]